jgi:predicted Zn finger-like uncharacterized protein
MRKSDVTCPECGAGFRRIELTSEPGQQGQYRCPACDTVLEAFDGNHLVAYRLTIQPGKTRRGVHPVT